MSLIRKIAYNTSVQVAGKLLSTALGIAAIMLMTRILGPEQFGWYATAVGFLQFIGLFSDFGFTITTANMMAEPNFSKTKLLNTIFSWRLTTALIFNGLAPFIFLFFPYPAPIKTAVFITTFSFFAISLNQVFIGQRQARLAAGQIALGEILGRLVLVAGVALSIFYPQKFIFIMFAITAASIVNTAYLWSTGPKIRLDFDREISLAIYKKIWPNATAVLLNSFYLQGDRVILPLYTDQVSVGLYGAAYRVIDIITQISVLVMGLLMPLITYSYSRGDKPEFSRRSGLALNLVALILFPMVGGAIALATPVMNFVAGAEFFGAGKILSWLALAAAGVCFSAVFGHIILAIDRQRQALWIYGSNAILSIIGYFIFIPRFGVYGAAGVTIFSEFYAGLLLFLLARRDGDISVKFLTIAKIVLAGLVMTTALLYLPAWPVIVKIIIGAVIYVLSVWMLKIISAETIKQIFARPTVGASDENIV